MQLEGTGGARVPTVDGFDDLAVLGIGGSATVYAGTDRRSGDRCALKVLSGAMGDTRRFQRECGILTQISHIDGVVEVRQATFAEDGRPVIVMELLPGGTLSDRIRADPLAAFDVLTMGVKLAVALELAHRRGVFHRDIKPANVLFDATGQPALADFGIAVTEDQAASATTHRSLSPPHSPPERFNDAEVDPRLGDIWSLASTLYTALSGRPPFGTAADGGLVGLATRVAEAPVPPLERDDLPHGLEVGLHAAMAKDPQHRLPSMDAVAARLWEARERAIDITLDPRPFPGAERALPMLERVGEEPRWWHGAPSLIDPLLSTSAGGQSPRDGSSLEPAESHSVADGASTDHNHSSSSPWWASEI